MQFLFTDGYSSSILVEMLNTLTKSFVQEYEVNNNSKVKKIQMNSSVATGGPLLALKLIGADDSVVIYIESYRPREPWVIIHVPDNEELIGFRCNKGLRQLSFVFYEPSKY